MARSVILNIFRGPQDAPGHPIGRFAIGLRGQITLLDAIAPYNLTLQDIVAEVNQLETLRIKVPPEPGSEPGTFTRRDVGRDSANLMDAIAVYFAEKYELHLVEARDG